MFVLMVLAFMIAMIFMLDDKTQWMKKFFVASIIFNLSLLFGGIFGDPGVKPATYLHYTKLWFSGGKGESKNEEESDTSSFDEEN